MWDESVWTEDRAKWDESWSPVAKELQSADAVVVVVPEWGGMVPSGLKNFFLLCGNQELAHKPGLIVSVSGSRNGAYPVSELRMSSTKNNRLVYIPDHVIVRDAAKMLQGDEAANGDDQYLRDRIDYSLKVLNSYAVALKPVRSESFPRLQKVR